MSVLLLFLSFMFAQLVVLRAGNSAGRGYLSDEKQELVYCFLQVAVILGFLLHALTKRLLKRAAAYGNTVLAAVGACAVCASVMLFAPVDSAFYLAVTAVGACLVGFIGGAVYLRLSLLFVAGSRSSLCLGLGYAGAIALQYVLQLRWTSVPLLTALTLLCFAVLFIVFLKIERSTDCSSSKQKATAVASLKIVRVVAITLAMLVFINYYNTYIHHLQIASGYTEHNVYTWPRLLMIPGILLFGWIGDVKKGRFLPISALCMVTVAFLNIMLTGQGSETLNMCLYYLSLTAAVAYYHVTFLRLAPRTKRPVLWSGFGRMLDSAVVILSLLSGFSEFSPVTVLIIDIASLIVMIVLMAVSGDFDLTDHAERAQTPPLSADDRLPEIQERFGITPSEMKVLRELVLTDDKQEFIARRLDLSINTLRHHVTSIYKKTGVQTRAALCKLINDTNR